MQQNKRHFTKQIVSLWEDGHTGREIARSIKINPGTVNKYLREQGLEPRGRKGYLSQFVSEHEIQCSECNHTKNKEKYYFDGARKKYFSFCKECFKQRRLKSFNKSIKNYIRSIVTKRKARAKQKNVLFDIDVDFVYNIFQKQQGRCFYTDRQMEYERGKGVNRNGLSIDKVNPELGYVQGNVICCTVQANSVKNDVNMNELKEWLPGWYKRVEQAIRTKVLEERILL